MTDGAASLMTLMYGLKAAGIWQDRRGVNLLDTGAPWYDTYDCADGKSVALGPIEPKFWRDFIQRTGLAADPDLPAQYDQARWPALRERLTALFKTRTRDDWCALLEGSDACFAPVLSMSEAPRHPHNAARGTFVTVDGIEQPAPAPRFSRTPGAVRQGPARPGEGGAKALAAWGLAPAEVARLEAAGIVKTR
jgi:alpha-methylacyl-CoA racemase